MADSNPNVPDAATGEDYNLSLHIGGLFANMAASTLGVLLPILFAYTTFNAKTTSKIQAAIQTARTFGSGVIIATAFIHMLPSAFGDLADPSLPEIFQEESGYTGWAGLIAMISALLLHLLEFAATQSFFNRAKADRQRQQGRVHAVDRLQDIEGQRGEKKNSAGVNEVDSLYEGKGGFPAGQKSFCQSITETDPSMHIGHVHGGEIMLKNKQTESQIQHPSVHSHDHCHGSAITDQEQLSGIELQENRSREIGTYILEFGIALHSIIIGISLGTTVGAEFVSLLIALLFHQFFEGVALGGRIASLNFRRRSLRPWLLSAWFAISTPLGVLIGIGIRSTYDGESVTALVVQGVFDSCSAGILLYTGLVQLMSAEMNANPVFRDADLKHQVVQFSALWLGAAAMAIVGKWA
ncbi:hypothetical protein BG011_002864 [Mortierella polycephala]|uniref:Zinc/iron permease n=1 Tax=Mortierella polycephala TaxID=41804 RepID=A0A9P6Q2A0_9FUNG|nr:hypothetical protein BG011_002864 [Mortierella polycephala]